MTGEDLGDNNCHLCGSDLPEIIYAPQSPHNRNAPSALNRWCLPLFEGRHVTDAMAGEGHEYAFFTVCQTCHDQAIEAAEEEELRISDE